MTTVEIIKKLSTRATAAEQMIQLLRKQVDEIRLGGNSGMFQIGFFLRVSVFD